MKHAHLDSESLDHLLRQDQDAVQNRLLMHHLAVCPTCREAGGYLLELYEEERIDLHFTPVDVELALSRREAPALWSKLEPHSAARRRALARDLPRFTSWGLAELLCEQSRAAAAAEPAAAVELAELAVQVAEQVGESQSFHEDWSKDLLAYAWAHVGNALRVLSELRGAHAAFERAEDLWEAGSGGCLPFRPTMLALLASLRIAQHRFGDALALLERVQEVHRKAGDHHQTGRILVKKATVLEECGELEAAISTLEEAAALIDEDREPRLALCLRHNLADCLTTAERLDEARALLPEVRRRSVALGNPLDLVRLRWVEGRIALRLGEISTAEATFREVRGEFAARGIGYDAALVSLDLALVYAREGRTAEIKQLAQEMLAVFRSRDIHREALAALIFFQQAANVERVNLDLVEQLTEYLHQARNHPGLRFEP